MNTRTALPGLGLDFPRPAPRLSPLGQTSAVRAARASWVDRFVAWAERQPMHHRMGSWERIRDSGAIESVTAPWRLRA